MELYFTSFHWIAKIPGIIEQPAKIDNTQLTVKMSRCPECCFRATCGILETILSCKNSKFCPRSRLANQERNQPIECPECCSEGNCATGMYCNDPEICPGLANQEKNQPNKGNSLFYNDTILPLE